MNQKSASLSARGLAATTAGLSVPLTHFLGWLASAFIASLALARISVWIQEAGFAAILLPIILGGSVGAATVLLGRLANQFDKRAMLIAAIALASICIIAEHLLFYFDYRTNYAASVAKNASVQIFQSVGGLEPAGFLEFLRVGANQSFGVVPGWLWWIIDAGLTIVAAVGTAAVLGRGLSNDARAKPQAANN